MASSKLRKSGLVKIERFSLPNLLADAAVVPEILQEEATGEGLGAAVLGQLQDEKLRRAMTTRFADLGKQLRCNANAEAAQGVAELMLSKVSED